MNIGIIGAMDEEIAYLKNYMIVTEERTIAGSNFIQGTLNQQQVVLVKSGIGKVNAAVTATLLMELYHPQQVINTGTAGGIGDLLETGDIVIGKETVHHDVDVTGFEYKHGQVPGMPERYEAKDNLIDAVRKVLDGLEVRNHIGLIATGDSFMDKPEKINKVKELFPDVIALEMEAAAIAQVCFKYNVPFVIIRALSDIAGKDAPISFDEFVKIASDNAAKLIIELIKDLQA